MLSVLNLTKYYNSFKALDGITFSVPKGKKIGLLGPNGAGKTTTIRILTGMLPKSGGEIEYDGQPLDPKSKHWKLKFGIVPEVSNAFLDYTPLKNMHFLAKLYGLSSAYSKMRTLELLREFDLFERKDLPTKKLSKGQKQRLNFCMAQLHDPDILFLDEPTAGLDVGSVQVVRSRINDLSKQGKTIFLTTHNLIEANNICDEIIILNKGTIISAGAPEALRKQVLPLTKITFELSELPTDFSIFQELGLEFKTESAKKEVIFFTGNPYEDFLKISEFFSKKSYKITQFAVSRASLEEIFLKILG